MSLPHDTLLHHLAEDEAAARSRRVRLFVREPLLHIVAQTLDGVPGVSVERERRRGKERRTRRLMREHSMRKGQRRGAAILGFTGIVTPGG